MWVLDYQLDLAADFRRFFQLSPAEALALPGPEYFALTHRVGAYGGVMAMRLEAERVRLEADEAGDGARLATDPALAELVDYVEVG